MRKVNFEKIKPGDLVEVPRTQFAPNRRGWNGWLFSNAVVISKGLGAKTGRPCITVTMQTPGRERNNYNEVKRTFFAEHVFYTNSLETAKRFMQEDGVTNKEEFEKFAAREDVTGCDWIRFLVDKGFLF
ncbi:hypothetical protein [Phascolarctobacterium sp.]|uniref:hypothetical protein n=1 Tax=Phascolarctobacterium sp. TaxID=2049039 RepID=UPI003868E8C7